MVLMTRNAQEVDMSRPYDCYRAYKGFCSGKLYDYFMQALDGGARQPTQNQRGVVQGFLWKAMNGREISDKQRKFFEETVCGIANLDIRFVRAVFWKYSLPEWGAQPEVQLPEI